MANIVDRNEQQVVIPPPIRGMNTTDPPHRLPEGMGIDLWNVEIDEVLGINKRQGFTPFNTASTMIPRSTTGTIREITGAMVYGSGTTWTASVCATSDVFFMPGNSSAVFWQIANLVGTATLSLAVAYSQTATASSYRIGPKEVGTVHNFKYGTTQKLLAFAGSDGFVATAGLTGSFSAINAGLTDYQRVQGVTFLDAFYFCNGYQFKVYDGSTASAVSGSPTPSDPLYVCVYTIGNANYLCISGSNTNADKSRFSISDVNAASTWPSVNRYFAGDRDGTVVTGNAPIPGGLAIFKDTAIFVFSGIPGSGSLRKVVSDIGCTSPGSIVAHKGFVYFIGKRGGKLGLFRFDGSPNIVSLSDSIEETLATLALGSDDKFYGEIYEDKYVIVARSSAGTFNNRHFICYIERPFESTSGAYFPWVWGNRQANALVNQEISGTNRLFSASPTGGFVYLEDSGNSDDTTETQSGISAAINAYAETAWMDFGDNSRKKELKRAYIDATESGDWNLTFNLYKNFETYGGDSYFINIGASAQLWSEIVYLSTPWQTALDKNVTEVVFRYPAISRVFKFRWANSAAAQPFSVYPMTCYFKREQT